MMSEVGVHRTHCCIKHGCKYGDDDCPVENGSVTQEYQCQDCSEFPEEAVDLEPKSEDNSPKSSGEHMITLKLNTSDGKFINKIEAIKGLRSATGLGLKESKELVERTAAGFPESVRENIPPVDDPTKVMDGKRLMSSGGVSFIVVDLRRSEVLTALRDLVKVAVGKSQYDLADQLLTILAKEDI